MLSMLGLSLFLSGFLLSRHELRKVSTKQEFLTPKMIVEGIDLIQADERFPWSDLLDKYSVPREREERVVVLFIIDALRFDFFHFNRTAALWCQEGARAMKSNLEGQRNVYFVPPDRNFILFPSPHLLA